LLLHDICASTNRLTRARTWRSRILKYPSDGHYCITHENYLYRVTTDTISTYDSDSLFP